MKAGKYELTREQLKRKELVAQSAQTQCDLCTEALQSLIVEKRQQHEALQQALGESRQVAIST